MTDFKEQQMRYRLIVLIFLLAACGTDAIRDEDDIKTGDVLYSLDFEDATSFETGDFSGAPEDTRPFEAKLTIEDGFYQIHYTTATSSYIWGQGSEAVQNSQVEAEARPLADGDDYFYGVMCRVDENGAGYAFLISTDGYGAIARADGRSLSFLANWRESDAIKQGDANNKIRVVCVENYLALYVNDEFVADAEDNDKDERHLDEGQTGFIVGVLNEKRENIEMTVAFDDLTVREASLKK